MLELGNLFWYLDIWIGENIIIDFIVIFIFFLAIGDNCNIGLGIKLEVGIIIGDNVIIGVGVELK